MDITGLGSIAELGTAVINRIWPDANEREKAKLQLLMTELSAELEIRKAQLAINQAEATHPSVWVAGWRPAIGWIGVLTLFATYIGQPFAVWVCWVIDPTLTPPRLETDRIMSEIIFGLLGIGGMRSFEKMKGLTK